jgi:hypothetical protein
MPSRADPGARGPTPQKFSRLDRRAPGVAPARVSGRGLSGEYERQRELPSIPARSPAEISRFYPHRNPDCRHHPGDSRRHRHSAIHQRARENTIKDELRYLRTQIAVYKAQHEDVPPGYSSGNPNSAPSCTSFADEMTEHTDINSNTSTTASSTFGYGPYLSQMPTNPINGDATMEMVPNNQPMPAPDGTTGWVYQPQTQQIMVNLTGNDSSGIAYSSY